jgi:hypothetical protein
MLLFISTFNFPSLAENDPFKISIFSDTSMTIPAVGNSFIMPVANTTLKQITNPPTVLEKGQVLLRRRFGAREYGLYIGIMNPNAYSKLSAFKPSETITITAFINKKIYSSQTTNPDQDIENVYFDGDLIYVENIAKVFYFEKEWKKIKMLDVLPCRLNITSEPVGAPVYVNNEYQGVTPVYMGAIYQPTAIIRLDMKGYFIAENFIDLQNGALIEKKFELKKKPVFEDGTEIDIEAYTAENTESVREINQRIETVRTGAAKISQDSSKALDAFIHNYPTILPKDQFETTQEFEKRKSAFNEKFAKEKDDLNRRYNEKSQRMLQVIPRMEAYLDNIMEREYTKYFDGNLLELSSYNADSGCFPIKMRIDEKGFAFTFKGSLFIPRDEAKDFYAKGTGSGKIVLIYKNWQINIQRDTVKESYFVYYTAFKLRFKDINYELRGTCGYPDYIENSPEYVKFTQALDQKREKERIARDARGTVNIFVEPANVKAQTFINSILIGATPIRYSLQPGNYRLTLEADGYKPISDSLSIVKDSLLKLSFTLEHTQGFLDSIKTQEAQTHKGFQLARRITFFSASIAAGGIGYWFDMQVEKNLNYYHSLNRNSSLTNFDAAWNLFEKNSAQRGALYAISALCLVAFAISIPF